MHKSQIPREFDLKATRRYKRQNMAKAMRGKIERALVELITNSDDSYRDLEESELYMSGKNKNRNRAATTGSVPCSYTR